MPSTTLHHDGFGTARPKIQWFGQPQGVTSGWLRDTYHNRELAVEIRCRHRANPPWRGPLRAWRSVHRSDRGPEVLFRLRARVSLTLCDFFCGPSAFGPSGLSACPSSARFPERWKAVKCQPHEKWLILIPCRHPSPGCPCTILLAPFPWGLNYLLGHLPWTPWRKLFGQTKFSWSTESYRRGWSAWWSVVRKQPSAQPEECPMPPFFLYRNIVKGLLDRKFGS